LELERAPKVLLANGILSINGQMIGASWPEAGDVATFERGGHRDGSPAKISLGVSARDAPRLERWTGEVARLLDLEERELTWLRIEKVDPALNILVGTLLAKEERTPPAAS
jgi:hypothetical protein